MSRQSESPQDSYRRLERRGAAGGTFLRLENQRKCVPRRGQSSVETAAALKSPG
ncbi:hypothetical protein D3C71_824250 [compost metagenome]